MNEPQEQLLNLLKNRNEQVKASTTPEAIQAAMASGKAKLVRQEHDNLVVEVPILDQGEIRVKEEEPDSFLYASNQAEMSKAQSQLVAWAEKKMVGLRKELKDAEDNLAHAKKMKWRKQTFEAIVAKLEKKVTFYEKVEAALKAGYTIIPDMDVQLFAVRTTRKSAKRNQVKGQWNRPIDQESNHPPLGEGRYVTPQGEQVWANRIVKHELGKEPVYEKFTWTEGHDDLLDFPFKMARPQILEAASEAMALKVFDEVGALPRFRKQPDPVLVGRITHKDGHNEKRFNFLIVWYIDTKEL